MSYWIGGIKSNFSSQSGIFNGRLGVIIISPLSAYTAVKMSIIRQLICRQPFLLTYEIEDIACKILSNYKQ